MSKLTTLFVAPILAGLALLAPVGATRAEGTTATTRSAARAAVYGPYSCYCTAYNVAVSLQSAGYRAVICNCNGLYYVHAY
jgi:hypothetical protein